MTGTFDLWQQAFSLASMTGAEDAQQGMPDVVAGALNSTLNTFFSDSNMVNCIGQWATVWGPVVFENTPSNTSYSDNTMYVAANADQTVYVVCIAGTNPNSTYDKDEEDELVQYTYSWSNVFSQQPPPGLKPCISAGTGTGVLNLLAMIDTLQNTNQTLVNFLKSLPASETQQATLIFCGHSLGGALAPTLALALFNPAAGKFSVSKSNWGAVYVYPTAGPTPGNADFGTFFSSVFAPIGSTNLPYQVWNMNVWNNIDIVPHAWNISMLDEITTLYPASWPYPPLKLTAGIAGAKHLSNEGAATGAGPYEQFANQCLQGTFNAGIPVSNFNSFENQALYQHTTAYIVLLNVQSLLPLNLYLPTSGAGAVRALLRSEQQAEAFGRKSKTLEHVPIK